MADQGAQALGTIFRGPDGALYYIQDEVLEALRLPANLAQQAEKLASGGAELQGFSLEVGPIEPVARVSGGVAQTEARPKSTIMCWSNNCFATSS